MKLDDFLIQDAPAIKASENCSDAAKPAAAPVAVAAAQPATKSTRNANDVVYSVEEASFCDVIIKKEASTESFLCLLPSQSQFYIKNRNGINALTKSNVRGFFTGLKGEFNFGGCNWIDCFPEEFNIDNFIRLVNDHLFVELAKRNLVKVNVAAIADNIGTHSDNSEGGINAKEICMVLSRAAKKVPAEILRRTVSVSLFENPSVETVLNDSNRCSKNVLFMIGLVCQTKTLLKTRADEILNKIFDELPASRVTKDYDDYGRYTRNNGLAYPCAYISAYCYLQHIYGISGIYNIVDTLSGFYVPDHPEQNAFRYGRALYNTVANLKVPKFEDYRKLFFSDVLEKARVFSLKEFSEYLASIINVRDGVSVWADTLQLQENIYGKVKNKYPEDLKVAHDMYSLVAARLAVEIDEKKFNKHVEKLKNLEWEDEHYIYICPKTKNDIFDEASQQSNCLAGYISAFTNGISDIMFMRDKKKPEVSLVTIEVRDGKLRQAYRACNNMPSSKELDSLHEWCKDMNIYCPDSWSPRAA